MIGATVSAEPGPDAAVIDLNVQPLVVVIRGEYRAYRLTGSIPALLAHYGNESSFYIRELTFPISFDAYPLNRSSLVERLFLIDRYIVFRLTSNHTCLAPGALVDVDHHTPFVVFCHFSRSNRSFEFGIKSLSIRRCKLNDCTFFVNREIRNRIFELGKSGPTASLFEPYPGCRPCQRAGLRLGQWG